MGRFFRLTVSIFIRLGTVFYLSYLLFEFPQNIALQRFPVGKWIRCVSLAVPLSFPKYALLTSINILVWGIALACTSACNNFVGLFILRFILGMCEGSVTAGFMIVTSMFYTRNEQTLRVGYWCMCISATAIGYQLITLVVTMSGTGIRDLALSLSGLTSGPQRRL